MIASRVGLRCTWVSISIGITVLPARLTRVAPGGTFTSAARPAATIRAPSTRSIAFSIGAPPSPTMRRAPSNAVTPVCARAGRAKAARKPRANVAAKAATFTRRIGASIVKADGRTLALLDEKKEGETRVRRGGQPTAPAAGLTTQCPSAHRPFVGNDLAVVRQAAGCNELHLAPSLVTDCSVAATAPAIRWRGADIPRSRSSRPARRRG